MRNKGQFVGDVNVSLPLWQTVWLVVVHCELPGMQKPQPNPSHRPICASALRVVWLVMAQSCPAGATGRSVTFTKAKLWQDYPGVQLNAWKVGAWPTEIGLAAFVQSCRTLNRLLNYLR